MRPPSVLVVVPTFGHFDYALKAVQSALAHTTTVVPYVVVVDDASPDFHESWAHHSAPTKNVSVIRLPTNFGLTNAWNQGLRAARGMHTYTAVTNSDVVFTPGWDRGLVEAVERHGYALAGPLTNAPGTERLQDVRRYLPGYEPSDDPADLAATAAGLAARYGGLGPAGGNLNGFCLFARTDVWWAHAHDAYDVGEVAAGAAATPTEVFKPLNLYNARGQRNPTPRMTLQEYELQGRWRRAGLKAGFCLSSFVFHYRSVSRGAGHGKGQAYRPPTKEQS